MFEHKIRELVDSEKSGTFKLDVDMGITSAPAVFTNSGIISNNDTVLVRLKEDGSFDKSFRCADLGDTVRERVVTVLEGYNKKETIKVEHMETYNLPIYEHAAILGKVMGLACNVHFFAGGEGRGSFGWHTDTSAVFCYMIKGHKRMSVADEVYDLTPGTWLYMPNGIKHMAENITDTIMLSFGFFSFWEEDESYYI